MTVNKIITKKQTHYASANNLEDFISLVTCLNSFAIDFKN